LSFTLSNVNLTQDGLSTSDTTTVIPLRQRMIEDMAARNLNPHTQRSHISSGESICNRNRIMTAVRFLLRVTLRRHDLAAEVWHLKEPQKLPPVLSPEEVSVS
jgi:integrase/recombinase XerD